jgi:four helix bundle protein
MDSETRQIRSFEDLVVFKLAYEQAMTVFRESKSFPNAEKYSLIDQIRRSSRSVCTNLAEAWAKRRYEAHFISKLTDADGENQETSVWLKFSRDCEYMEATRCEQLLQANSIIGAKLGQMIKKSRTFLLHTDPVQSDVQSPKSDL